MGYVGGGWAAMGKDKRRKSEVNEIWLEGRGHMSGGTHE